LVDRTESLIARQPAVFRDKYDIEVNLHQEVKEIDPDRGAVLVLDQNLSQSRWESYSHLMLSPGAVPVRPPVEGIDARGIFGINTLQSGLDVMAFIDKYQPKSAVVVGGGYIGLEMAENLLLRGLKVSLVEKAPEVMGTLDPDMGALVSRALIDMGIALYRNEGLKAFDVKAGRVAGVVTDYRTINTDLVILGIGVRPNVALAEAAGIKLGPSGAVQVDATMRTGRENIWAGGDCAESFHLVSRRPVNIALGTVANRHGRVAGTNIGGEYAAFGGVVGTAVSKICALEVARTGLQEKEIQQTGREYVTALTESKTRASYYPGTDPITVKILAEKSSGKLLGGQIAGGKGAAKRIDVLATALHAGMDLEQVADLDLSYAPPFSPLWDPVVMAARNAMKALV
jgi:NADPH-dependent 2,4-dienoyl-CoA reductase/sulfur reductase-like enzyme